MGVARSGGAAGLAALVRLVFSGNCNFLRVQTTIGADIEALHDASLTRIEPGTIGRARSLERSFLVARRAAKGVCEVSAKVLTVESAVGPRLAPGDADLRMNAAVFAFRIASGDAFRGTFTSLALSRARVVRVVVGCNSAG
jgi:hypothetical protein